MQKAILIVPAKFAIEMIPNTDADQKLASGSYLIATKPKKPTARAKTMRQFRNRRLDAGYRRFEVLLPAHIYNALYSLRREGETFVKLFERLLSGDDNQNHIVVEDE